VLRPQVAVGAVVLAERDGRTCVLMIRRAQPPALGRWTLPGGRVERGETLADALVREMREETGLEVNVGALVEVVDLIDAQVHYVVLDYACAVAGGALQAGDDAGEVAWVDVRSLDAVGASEAVKRVVAKAGGGRS